MIIATLSSREFNQGTNEAKRAHVLMGIEFYPCITESRKQIADLLAMPSVADIDFDFEIPHSRELARPADFS